MGGLVWDCRYDSLLFDPLQLLLLHKYGPAWSVLGLVSTAAVVYVLVGD
jgi:hypothetical protein